MSDHEITLRRVREVCAQRAGNFYTPETKDEADGWLDVQSSVMPTAIAFMVGFNYALRQVEKQLEAGEPIPQSEEER